jgi:hypothetical protein
MTVSQIDPETGDYFPPFGVEDGTFVEATEQYKKVRGGDVEENAMYLIKANAPINTEAYSYAQTQMSNGKIKFLLDEASAKLKLMATKSGQAMDVDKRNEYLMPFVQTSILKEQAMNLVEQNEGTNIILKQASRGIKKDKFSAFIYGLLYIKRQEDVAKKKKKRNISDFMFFS